MVKLIGKNKINAVIFFSGKGSNLKNLIIFSKKKKSPIKVSFVVSSNRKANGIILAKKKGIKCLIFDFKKKGIVEKKILKLLKKNKIKIILLAGFMKILSKKFIKIFRYPIINIHPSLLPKYKGLNTHERVIKNKEKFSGCTVHLINEKLDSGKIIMQKKLKVYKSDDSLSLKKRILKEEHKLYPVAISRFLSNL
tara:strand:+ start:6345 stop:6929 length:585 start_codon:yes stop_codon:yes gene_type:complete